MDSGFFEFPGGTVARREHPFNEHRWPQSSHYWIDQRDRIGDCQGAPGFVLTPLIERQIEAKAQELGMPREAAIRELLKEKQPSMRFTQVDEIGALLAFLCNDAAANIPGASLPIDGGWTAQ